VLTAGLESERTDLVNQRCEMKGLVVFGIALLLAGLAMLAWPAITYTKSEKAIDIGPLEVTTEHKERIPLPPILGVVAAGAGVALIVMGSRGR
jgi:hypothetical protein